MNVKKTLVLGASNNPERYSNMAIRRLLKHGHPVVAIGKKQVQIESLLVENEQKNFDQVDTVTLYINPRLQKEYYEYIISLRPMRIIFNPGTENDELAILAKENNIEVKEACTLVLLATGQY